MHAYVTSYLDHIRVEEAEVLPLTERRSPRRHWAETDAAFMQNRDPLTHREGDATRSGPSSSGS